MKPTKPITDEQIMKMLVKTKGKMYLAASNLGVSHTTLYNRVNASEELLAELDTIRSKQIDFVESKLDKLIEQDNPTAIIFFLKTQGKGRGWSERTEITGDNGKPVEMVIRFVEDD